MSGNGPIRVPPLVPAKAAEYAGLFEKSGAVNGVLSGMSFDYLLAHLSNIYQVKMQRRFSKKRGYPMKSSDASGIFPTPSSAALSM